MAKAKTTTASSWKAKPKVGRPESSESRRFPLGNCPNRQASVAVESAPIKVTSWTCRPSTVVIWAGLGLEPSDRAEILSDLSRL